MLKGSDAVDIAVVISSSGTGRTVIDAIDTALWQTRRVREIVVLDDAQDPQTTAALKSLRRPRTRVIRLPKQPVRGALALARCVSEAEVVALLGEGELMQPTFVERLLEVLQENPQLGAVTCATRELGGDRLLPMSPADFPSGLYRTTEAGRADAAVSHRIDEPLLARRIHHGSGVETRSSPLHEDARPRGGMILLYHRISTAPPDLYGLSVAPEDFRAHLELLKRRCNVLSVDDLEEGSARGTLPERAVALTFDDGYLDSLEVASPILTELGLPATFFVNGEAEGSEGEVPWEDILQNLFLTDRALPSRLELETAGKIEVYLSENARDRSTTFQLLSERIFRASAGQRREILETLEAWSGGADPGLASRRRMTANEVRELGRRPGHSIGAHTASHLFLPGQSAETVLDEMTRNRRYLERLIDDPVLSFAYPYGAVDVHGLALAQRAGFRRAVTTASGNVRPTCNPFLLPRWEVRVRPPLLFEQWLNQVEQM